MNDADFERRLLDSARADGPPDDARSAWARLSSVSSSIHWGPRSDTAGDGRRHGWEATADPAVGDGRLWRAARGTSLLTPAKWLLLGAIGGSALTAAVMVGRRSGRSDAPAGPVVARESRVPANVAEATGDRARVSLSELGPAAAPKASTPSAAHPRRSGPGGARATQARAGSGDSADEPIEASATDSSTLAAEVSRIDAARTANARGDYDQAIRGIERYHRDFPEGALAPDADVVALEAVAAKHDRPETARRAALFLSRYPDDPHTARVRWLAEH
jgi:hypothetical protein